MMAFGGLHRDTSRSAAGEDRMRLLCARRTERFAPVLIVLWKDHAEASPPPGMAELRVYCRWPGRAAAIGCVGLQSWSTQSSAGPVLMISSQEGPSRSPCYCGEQGLHNPHEHTDRNLWEWLGPRLARSIRCNTGSRPAVCNRRLPTGIFADSPRLVTSRCDSIEMQRRTREIDGRQVPRTASQDEEERLSSIHLIRLSEFLPVRERFLDGRVNGAHSDTTLRQAIACDPAAFATIIRDMACPECTRSWAACALWIQADRVWIKNLPKAAASGRQRPWTSGTSVGGPCRERRTPGRTERVRHVAAMQHLM